MDSLQNTPPIPPPQHINMDKLIEQLFERMTRLELDVRECNANHKETLQLQNGAIVRALEQNTRVLEKIEKSIILWERKKAPAARRTLIRS